MSAARRARGRKMGHVQKGGGFFCVSREGTGGGKVRKGPISMDIFRRGRCRKTTRGGNAAKKDPKKKGNWGRLKKGWGITESCLDWPVENQTDREG